MWSGLAPGTYDKATGGDRNLAISALHDALCKPN